MDEDHLLIPEIADYVKSFDVIKLEMTYVVSSLRDHLVELKKDRNIYDIVLFLKGGDTLDLYVCEDSMVEYVDQYEG